MYQSDAHIPSRQDQFICQAETLIKFMVSDKQAQLYDSKYLGILTLKLHDQKL